MAHSPAFVEPSPPEIELHGVTIEAALPAGQRVLHGLDWAIGRGDFWVVGGLPGAGKTVLLETAAALRPPAAGTLTLFGMPAERLSEREWPPVRRRIGFVYGGGGRLLTHLTLAQNVALPLCYHRNCPVEAVAEEVAELLSRFSLLALAERLPGQVSPAYRQRAALVRALALRPDVMFLDDPLAELNTAQVRWWLERIGGAGERDDSPTLPRTWVIATDDLRLWLGVGRQFGLLQDGRWRVLGNREALVAAPEPLVRELLAESPVHR